MVMCSRCNKSPAVVFIRTQKNGEDRTEGFCLKCAKELGIKPLDDIIAQTGLDDETIERLNEEMQALMDSGELELTDETSRAPLVNFSKLMGDAGQEGRQDTKKGRGKKKDGEKEAPVYKFLDTYTTNLTQRARDGKLDNIVGRERELDRMIQILCRRQKNNPCLIGEPGVGKTAIAEGLALRIAAGDVPAKIADKEIQMLDIAALVAGTQFRGQFESRIKGLIEEVKAQGNIILFIDEVHQLVGAGESEGSMNAANILKPSLSRGEIQIIGATTFTEYRKYIEKDAALERRLQPIKVEEPSIEQTTEMLIGVKDYYEN